MRYLFEKRLFDRLLHHYHHALLYTRIVVCYRYFRHNLAIRMLVPQDQRRRIYEKLFEDGVMIAVNDLKAAHHVELADIPNLHVVKVLQGLVSKKLVKEQYNWRTFYFTLTDEGIEYLRSYLHLPSEIVPATLKTAVRQ